MDIQTKIQALRKKEGLSQEQLAEKIGVSRQAVAKWELGQSIPELEKLIDLSNFFKISIDRLVKDLKDENCSFHEVKSSLKNYREIIDFLMRAKKSTYAGNGPETVSSRLQSHDLEFKDGDFYYLDTYVGGEKFAGEEALWYKENPIWSMNYIGRVLNPEFSGAFLKECLLLVPQDSPFRGPLSYGKGDYSYHSIVQGDFDWYQGYEEIFCKTIKVYECFFHGGLIN
jgi:transcriptional regulator with XRE-family HTH domain